MKLLYVLEDRFEPFRADVVELFARQLGRLPGWQIDWAMRGGPSATVDQVEWQGARVFLSGVGRASALGRLLTQARRSWRLAHAERYDVIQVRDRIIAAPWYLWLARRTGARFVFWMSYPYAESKLDQARSGFVRSPWLTALKGRVLGWLLYRLVLPRADHVFVQSERMRSDVVAKGIDPGKLSAVPMGIRVDQVGAAQDARAPRTVAPVLLHLGIILKLRRSEMLVRVLALVRQHYPDATLVYVGAGMNPSDTQAVLDEAQRLGVAEAVHVTGFLPMAQAWERVEQADICYSPFYPIPVLESTSPTKLIEYMAMAKCVVGNHHPEQSQVMRDSGVGQTVAWDEQAFAQATLALLAAPHQAQAQAARGPDFVRQFRTYDVIAKQVASDYQRLLSLRARRG